MFSIRTKLNDKALSDIYKNTLKNVQIKVGLPKGTPNAPGENQSTIEIGAIHEFGSPSKGIPERSFIRETFNTNREAFTKIAQSEARKLLEGEQGLTATIERLGLWGQGIIQKKFRVNNWTPNAPFTVALKGSSRPLIDTGHLLQSITWEVIK